MPMRQPKSCDSTCPMGAAIIAPSEPAAETMPSTVERSAFDTAREATEFAIAAAVQDSEMPISTPAPIRMLTNPCADASVARPAT